VSDFVQYVAAKKDFADALASGAQVVALFAGAGALWKYRSDVKSKRQDAARLLYTDFMKWSIDNPDMYGGSWTDGSLTTPALRQKYVYYMGMFLWSAEELLREFGTEQAWVETIKVTVREHSDYFHSDEFSLEEYGYSDDLRSLVRETV
jgi:hypothetical protein